MSLNNFIKAIICLAAVLFVTNTNAQWTNHYKKLDDFGHHVYLEQHELPILAHGITDPAPSPDGKNIAISSKGWLWLLDIKTGVATRLTHSNGMDARPRWSPDGKHLAFVRDFSHDTAVVIKDIESGEETLINTDAIELDPEFSADGESLYFSSGVSGSVNLYQYNLANKTQQSLTDLRQVERNARRLANGFVYLHGEGAHRVLRKRNLDNQTDEIIQAQTLTYHLSSDVHPTQNLLVYSAPIDNDYHLYTMDIGDTRVSQRLTDNASFAITPAFSASGEHIYYVVLDDKRQFRLMQIPTHGGQASEVKVRHWNYGVATGNLELTILGQEQQASPARVSIVSKEGHPVASQHSATFDDPQSGRTYFYLDSTQTLVLPVGEYKVEAVSGPFTPVNVKTVTVKQDESVALTMSLKALFNSAEAGYQSADFHVHLNGDGHHRAEHSDALLLMKGEDLDYLAPMSWNRWERKIDKQIVGKRTNQGKHLIIQGQEVRSHFHGHVGLLNVKTPFSPWFFGPNNPQLGNTDLSNSDVFAYANQVGAFATYVHPISTDADPFAEENINSIPLELLSDGILEPNMGLEIVCAWTSSLGTAQLWYRLLNIGKPVSAMSGTDGWIDFHRTPAVGTGRAYIRPVADSIRGDAILDGAIAGRSFLSTGPALIFSLGNGAKPGDVTSGGLQTYSLEITSTSALQTVEIIVNGQVVETLEGAEAGTSVSLTGNVNLPEGGWVAARAYAHAIQKDSWPSMHARPFAHSSPIWINEIGSTDSAASATAAADLLRGVNAAEMRAKVAYGKRDMPKLYQRFSDARQMLEAMVKRQGVQQM